MSTAPSRPPADAGFSHRNLPLLLLQARERLMAHTRPILHEHGLTEQQWRIVRALLESGPVEQREIVGLCCISSPSLAGILARMEEIGLVARARLDHDQRRVRVSLTAKSKGLAARIAPRIEAVYADIEARVGVEFTGRLYAMLDQLIAIFDAPETRADAA